jgi:hypothetical protein
MLTRVDRIQVSTNDPYAVVDNWIQLLDAREVSRDQISVLAANRITLDVGDCQIEVLSPDGEGRIQAHLQANPGGPFAVGFATQDIEGLKTQLERTNTGFQSESGQIFIDENDIAIPGLRLVISADQPRQRQGLMQNLYEVTHLTSEEKDAASRFSRVFGLDPGQFVAIESDNFGYQGCLTLINPDELDRIEIINPYDLEKTMGRFFTKFGPSLYMCYGECDDLPALRDRLEELAPNDWTGAREGHLDGLFIHPKALGGVMLGVSRTTFAWSWSGSPDRIEPPGPEHG